VQFGRIKVIKAKKGNYKKYENHLFFEDRKVFKRFQTLKLGAIAGLVQY
jgi:hypothetical protein